MGIKPYLSFCPPYIPNDEIRIYDFLTKEHLALCDKHGWVVQLHIALKDYEAAYCYVQELLDKEPRFIEAYYNAALVEKELGKYEDAKAHLEHALTIRTTFMSSYSHEDAKALLETLPV